MFGSSGENDRYARRLTTLLETTTADALSFLAGNRCISKSKFQSRLLAANHANVRS